MRVCILNKASISIYWLAHSEAIVSGLEFYSFNKKDDIRCSHGGAFVTFLVANASIS